ncbi:uncharacterized protein LOC127415587 [Myxocyprinus asiaticus]|uniref:uncharacterized protein LOC127415587 n=1 Tax=Myxocyprinus asiaticus TaxID=70543 RepID=UPI002221592C|nr:uncharacterized protein LOC127415587 [Myxocyprinus asiaticus]
MLKKAYVRLLDSEEKLKRGTGLMTECLGSIMRLTVDKSLAFGSQIEFDAINGSQVLPLTPSLAVKCGFSVESDPWGNTRVFASLLNCFAGNEDDREFDLYMRVRVRGINKAEQDVIEVEKFCTYNQWAPREILCDRNYMEVSVNRLPGEITALKRRTRMFKEQTFDQWTDTVSEAVTSRYNIWRMVFFTPKQKAMVLEDALKTGYGVTTTRSRLVLRSGFDMPETYVENVNGVPMKVIRVTTYFKKQWSVTMLDTVAACPTGGLVFTDELITWNFPRFNPLMSSTENQILGMVMGIDGKQIDSAQMAARGYSLTTTDTFIVMTLPVGGPDGYYKSHFVNDQYHIRYTIEPMLELFWSEGGFDATRYKVFFPIKTPFMPRPPQSVDYTAVDQKVFDVLLGTFLYDVELVNITFSTGVLTVVEANARGFNVQEQRFQNGSKAFRLQVPFSDPVVTTQVDLVIMVYTLPLVYGFMILPEYTPFSYSTSFKATLQDVILPTVSGTCDKEKFHIMISFGNLGKNFNIMLGTRDLTPERSVDYDVKENGTHMILAVPFLAFDVAFELMYPSSLRARLDVLLWEPTNKWSLGDFSLACNFPMTMTECFSNGSISALAVKVQSVSQLVPRQLTLRDPRCKPKFSNDRFAYFSFDANSCGTTRTFYDGVMMYQNEISLGDEPPVSQQAIKGVSSSPLAPEYRVTVSCFYTVNDTQAIAFFTKPRESEPLPEIGFGELQVLLRLALDGSYKDFYVEQDFPVGQYLRKPLFFEVALLQSTDPRIELVLENCWATLKEGRNSTPRWDLIVDGCVNLADHYETVFHPVSPDGVQFPSHFKRFEIKMFAFVQDNIILKDQIFVHCDALLCDVNQTDGICKRQCPSPIPLKTAKKV